MITETMHGTALQVKGLRRGEGTPKPYVRHFSTTLRLQLPGLVVSSSSTTMPSRSSAPGCPGLHRWLRTAHNAKVSQIRLK